MEAVHTRETVKDYAGRHPDGRFVVAGIGPSIKEADGRGEPIVIGVNDVERYDLAVDYLLTVDSRNKIGPKRWKYIQNTQAKALFFNPNHCGKVTHEKAVPFALVPRVRRGHMEWPLDDDQLFFNYDSPWIATCLAARMGAKEIGLIGVDHTGDHHNIGRIAKKLCVAYRELGKFLDEVAGIRLVKLSEYSNLVLDYVPYQEWIHGKG